VSEVYEQKFHASVGGPILELVVVAPTRITLDPEDTYQLTAIAHYSGGVAVDVTQSIDGWSSNDPSVATVSVSGLVTAQAMGVANISVSLGASVGTTHVVVTGAPPSPVDDSLWFLLL
jgi:uncharacterized protein YjdB